MKSLLQIREEEHEADLEDFRKFVKTSISNMEYKYATNVQKHTNKIKKLEDEIVKLKKNQS